MLLERTAISQSYDVLPVIPLPDGVEELTWATNIFIAADLTETRVSLSPYPAIKITYNFKVNCQSRSWLQSLPTSTNNYWQLIYFPYSSPATIRNGVLTIANEGGVFYPYQQFIAIYDRSHLSYYPVSSSTGTSETVVINTQHGTVVHPDGEVIVAPCFEALIAPNIKYQDLGNLDGHTVSLTFRMSGPAERRMTYHVDSFDFVGAVQRPLSVDARRHQSTYSPPPAPAHTYSPIARLENQVPKSNVTYWLDYHTTRDDYAFRGSLMKGLGAATAGHYLTADNLHRLQDDKVSIRYGLRVAKASTVLREVSA